MLVAKYEFADLLKLVFKWFITRSERDENDGPLIGDDFKSKSMNEMNLIAWKLMEHGAIMTKAIVEGGLLQVYMATMGWKTTLAENLDVKFIFKCARDFIIFKAEPTLDQIHGRYHRCSLYGNQQVLGRSTAYHGR